MWGDYSDLHEEKVTEDKLVYKKSNEITKNEDGKIISHGATRAVSFICK